jgi:hypothetical protein
MELTDELAAISIDTEPRKVLNEAPKKGKGKVRKGQSAEEYQRQVDLYTSGPPVQTLTVSTSTAHQITYIGSFH